MKKKSLKEFLFKKIIIMVILPMFILSCASILISVNSIRKRIERKNIAVINMVNHFVDHYEELIMQVGEVFYEKHVVESEKNNYLNTLVKTHHILGKIEILNLKGVIKYSSQGSEKIGYDMSNFEFVEKAIENDEYHWSEVMQSSSDGTQEIMLAKRLGENILVGYVNIENLNIILKESLKNTGSKMVVLDNIGNIIFYDIDGMDSERKSEIKYKYISALENNNSKNENFIKGRDTIIENYGRIGKTGWDILLVEDVSKGFIFLWDFYRQIVFGIGLFTLIIIYISYSGLDKLLKDMNKLKLISEKVSAGELPETLNYEISETEDLAGKFRLMGKVVLEREKNIKEKAAFLQNLLDTIPSPVFYKDKNHVYLGCNKAFAEYIGVKKGELPGKGVYDVSPKDKADIYKEADDKLLESGEEQVYHSKLMDKDGKIKDVKFYKSVFRDLNGQKNGIIGVILDITNLKEAIRTAEKKERMIEILLDTVPLPIYYQDKDGKYINCNKAFEELVGMKKDKIKGNLQESVWGEKLAGCSAKRDMDLLKNKKHLKSENNIIDKNSEARIVVFDKTLFYTEEGEIGGIIGAISDITDIRHMQEELKVLSIKDSLTGIYNRRGFEEMSERIFKESLRNKKNVSIIMLDIDKFKLYNDHYGHQAGDECLKKIAEKLEKSCKRPSDIVGRYGGEEFIIFLPDTTLEGARTVAEKIRKNIENMEIEHVKSRHGGVVTVSLGISATVPNNEYEMEKLIGKADKMLYQAKELGRNRVEG
ncbi:sensor domain-containing diguanylate cyclase [Ilyobacter polytropus]|uniref:Diguanylate cyclase with PAS/PAC sensor n=1 Tax=Ilyobacter polytropus (strain ATCC 51220 / DSM 2926 / LMG 16218 / CuHBu1) TaxID=572544 RepID=E3H929_ILYPC|nr:diguanylate cyclase [Ilyobacter polytropus]ADO82001.1 diguanylate cyclase with PAS/PAC sensor [Ilyobacter polytropus DSM 2926]